MKRLITVFALAAALFVLMGCGSGSKSRQTVETPKNEVTSYVMPAMGEYHGSGYIKADDLETEAELTEAAASLVVVTLQSNYLSKEINADYFYALSTDQKEAMLANEVALKEQSATLEAEVAELEEFLIDFRMASIKFSLSADEESGELTLSNLVIDSDLDYSEIVTDENGEDISRTVRHFGDVIELNDNSLQYNDETGMFSFSFNHVDDQVTFAFVGREVEEGKIEGSISMLDMETGDFIQKGAFSVTLQAPVQEADAPVEDADEAALDESADDAAAEEGVQEEDEDILNPDALENEEGQEEDGQDEGEMPEMPEVPNSDW